MGSVKYTKSQQEVIDFRGNNLLVSAGAGSGKTTVMIERVLSLLTDKENPVKISRFLIISFTKASASDMKNKLISKLSSIEPTPYILEQLDDILTSDVSNLHSFCARLLKQYFYEVGLDPTFVVLDETQANVLKEKALTKLFADKTASSDLEFYALIDIFAKKRKDTGLKNAILKIHDFLCSITNKKDWFEQTINTLYETDLDYNIGAKVILSHMKAERSRMLEEIKQKKEICLKLDAKPLVTYLDALESKVLAIREDQGFYENAKRLADLPKLPRISKVDEAYEDLKQEISDFKDTINQRMKKLQEYALVENLEFYQEHLSQTQKNVYELFKLEEQFEQIYDVFKKEKCGLDFNDLEQNTLKVLENPLLLEEIRAKYDYIMVDEDQDINSVQEEILTKISRGNNLFMVGDVKQSIYRFRLCDPQIFLDKYYAYSKDETKGKLIKLNENFRSKNAILQFVNKIFDQTMTEEFGGVDYKREAQLAPGSESQIDDQKRVEILLADSSSFETQTQDNVGVYSVEEDDQSAVLEEKGRAEGLLIADKIEHLMKFEKVSDNGKMRKIKFSDITILAPARNAYLEKIVQALREKSIPVSTDVEGSCFDDEYVYALKSFLELLGNQKVDHSLFSVLASKIFDFSYSELAEIKILGGEGKFFYENLLNAYENKSLEENLYQKLDNFMQNLKEFRQKAKFLSAKEILLQIIERQNIWVKISFEDEGDKTKQKLSRFISSLGSQTVVEYLSDSSLSDIMCEPAYTNGAVNVMTIHKSKGLEFKVVFLAMASRNFNLENVRSELLISKDLGICMDFYDRELRYKTQTLAKEAGRLLETRKMLEEQQRLLYVALTRATDFLYVVACTDVNKIPSKMPASPMCFLDFMGHLIKDVQNCEGYEVWCSKIEDIVGSDYAKEKRQVIISEFDQDQAKQISQIFHQKYEHEQDITVPIKTAVTSLVSENLEHQSFKTIYEEASKSSAERGTLYHLVMSKLDLFKSKKEDVEKELEFLVQEGIISEEESQNINVESICKLLSNENFKSLIYGADKIFKEKEFYMLYGESAQSVVQGIVDLLIIKNGKLIIVDYKTGNISKPENLNKYEKQVNLYAIAMKKCFNLEVDKKCVASLENGNIIYLK